MKYLIVQNDETGEYDFLTDERVEQEQDESFWNLWVPITDLEKPQAILTALRHRGLSTKGTFSSVNLGSFDNHYYEV